MTHVIVASTSTDLTKRVRLATDDDMTVVRPSQVPATAAQLLAMFLDQKVSALVLDVTDGEVPMEHAIALTRHLEDQVGMPAVFLVSDAPETIALDALRAGARNVLAPSVGIEDLRAAIHGARELASRKSLGGATWMGEQGLGRVITVVSPKGGVGKTTLATNLALSLAHRSPQGTVIVDTDVQFGDVAAALDLEPQYTLGDIATTAVPDIIGLKALLTQHASGLQVIAGVRSPVEADRIDAKLVGHLLEVLKREFRYVVVDSAPGMSEETLIALDHTTDMVLVSTLDVPGIRGLRKEMDLLDELHLPPHTRHVILNMVDRAGGLSVADAEATLGRRADFVLPRNARVSRSTNQGVPIVDLFPRDRLTADLNELASRFGPLVSRRERRLGPPRFGARS